MPSQRDALRARFGLSALSAPPVVFVPTRQGKVWGLNSLGRKPEYASILETDVEVRPGIRLPAEMATAAPMDAASANAAFLEWLGNAYPDVLAAMVNALEDAETMAGVGTMNGLGETEAEKTTFIDRLVGMAETVLPAYLQYQQQSDILDVQLDRARQGLPPLNTGEYAASMQIGLDRDTVARIADEAGARARSVVSSPMPWIIGGLGVAAVLLLTMSKKRRRV